MRIFITGGTGYLGRPIVTALTQAGHEVTALSRQADRDATLEALGATPLRGSLHDHPLLQAAAREHDATLHVAIDYRAGEATSRDDIAAVRALLAGAKDAAARGERRSLVYTSGVFVLGNGDPDEPPMDETAPTDHPAPLVAWRPALEQEVLATGRPRGPLTTAVIRPGCVYGPAPDSLFAIFHQGALEHGAAPVLGSGEDHWAVVHADDLAGLYRRVAEQHASGIFHGVDGVPLRQKDLARVVSERAGKGGAIAHLDMAEARQMLGPLADALTLDQRVVTRRGAEVGWQPRHKGFPDGAWPATGA